MALIFLFYPCFFLSLYYMLSLKICVGVFSGIFKARMLKLGIHMDNELLNYEIENGTPCPYSSLYLSIFYPVFFVFVFRLLRICVTVFFATYLLLLIYSSALLKQCSGAIVRFSDSSSLDRFSFVHCISFLSPSLWDTARYKLYNHIFLVQLRGVFAKPASLPRNTSITEEVLF